MSEHIRLPLAHATRLFAATCAVCLLLIVSGATAHTAAQGVDRIERERALQMLSLIKGDVKKNYYDPQLRGIDIEARFKTAEEKIKQAQSLGQIFGIIAQALMEFEDSHLYFIPPARPVRVQYGWTMQMIGDKCFVTAVRPGSDAAAQGLKAGDELVAIEGFRPSRKEFWKMNYYYNALSPRPGLRVLARAPDAAEPRQLDIKARVKQEKRVINLNSTIDVNDLIRKSEDSGSTHRFRTIGSTGIWQMPGFNLEPGQVDRVMEQHLRNKATIIFDLRGNGGGYEVTLQRVLGYMFDHDIKVADLKGRKELKPLMAKTVGSNVFKGKVIVLIDSESGSSAELFARMMQLEKRGIVIGDQSAGAVMRARAFDHELGTQNLIGFAVSVTDADAVMSDGKSLERVGVTPDEKILPTAADLAASRDPVLARALALAGSPMSAEQAGRLFPVEWKD